MISARIYRYYLLAVLLVVTAFSSADLLALGIALQNIKLDLHFSDVQLGFLTGLAFTAFYAIAGIPLARWADRGNRICIVALTTAVWGVMVALTGRVMNFAQMALVRIGVGIGDAGIRPTANSLIPDYFTRAERPRAAAVYSLSWPATLLLGYFVAGWLNEYLGWRTMFMLLGIPGLGLAVLARLTLREPRLATVIEQSLANARADVASTHPGMRRVLGAVWTKATFRHLLISYAIMNFYVAGLAQWVPTFFVRSFGMGTGELGSWLALLMGATSLVSIYAGGELASRYAAHNERLQFRVIAAVYIVQAVDHAFLFLSPNAYVAFVFIGLAQLSGAGVTAPLTAALQSLMPSSMRATAIALVMLCAMLIGGGLGPIAAGALSEALRAAFGPQSLRFALLALSPLSLWAAWHMWLASRTVGHDLKDEPSVANEF